MSDASTPAHCLNCDQLLAPRGCFCPNCGQAPALNYVLNQVAFM